MTSCVKLNLPDITAQPSPAKHYYRYTAVIVVPEEIYDFKLLRLILTIEVMTKRGYIILFGKNLNLPYQPFTF